MPQPTDRVLRAEAALGEVFAAPARAAERADRLLLDDAEDDAASVALRVRALARKLLGDLDAALGDLRHSVRVAAALGLTHREAEARMSLVVMLADSGRTHSALAEADRAAAVLRGRDRARLLTQRGLVLQRSGRTDEALACYRSALPALRRYGDEIWEARLLGNRGPLRAYAGDFRGSLRDLKRSEGIARAQGQQALLGVALQNIGFTYGQAGDAPRALAHLDAALDLKNKLGMDPSSVLMDKAEVLLSSGLAAEAAVSSANAYEQLRARGFASDAEEARLLVARAALAADEPQRAAAEAAAAATALRGQHRPGWARLARHVEVVARYQGGERSAALLSSAQRSATDCRAAGWPVAAVDATLLAGRVAGELGRRRLAHRLLAEAADARRSGTAQARLTGWHALALLRLDRQDRAGTLAAARHGLRVLDENLNLLGATDLRAHAAAFGGELATLGLRVALDGGSAREVLAWSEAWRAGALSARSAQPPRDRRTASLLARLRQVSVAVREAGLEGSDGSVLHDERRRLERDIRDVSRRHASVAITSESWRADALRRALGRRALVELVRDDERLHAVVVVAGRVVRREVGGFADAVDAADDLRFALTRLAHGSRDQRLRSITEADRAEAAAALDDQLLSPVADLVDDRPLVLVPTGQLHALPWSSLPSLHARPVTVSPSARLWVQAAGRTARSGGQVVLVAGPRLDHARPEVRRLARRYRDATVLVGAAATAAATAAALDGAALAHVAAHGRFRADNPQFSALDLADGPLTVYDLERLRRPPRVLVLSACDSGLSQVRPGDELMGLAAAVLGRGTSSIVASVVPVPDDGTASLMSALHGRLLAGESPAPALAAAAAATEVEGFVCLGAG